MTKLATAWALLDSKGQYVNKRAYVNFSKDLVLKRYKENNKEKSLEELLNRQVIFLKELVLEVEDAPLDAPSVKTDDQNPNVFFVAVSNSGELLNYTIQSSPIKALKCLKHPCPIHRCHVIVRPSVAQLKLEEAKKVLAKGVASSKGKKDDVAVAHSNPIVATEKQKIIINALSEYDTSLAGRNVRVNKLVAEEFESEDERQDYQALKIIEVTDVLQERIPQNSWSKRVRILNGELIVLTAEHLSVY